MAGPLPGWRAGWPGPGRARRPGPVPLPRAVAAPGRGTGAAHAGPVRRAGAPPGHRGRGAGRMARPVLLLRLRDHPRHRPGDGDPRGRGRQTLRGGVRAGAPREAAKPNEIYLNAQAEHLLDWFHLTMRITVMANMAKSLPPPLPGPDSRRAADRPRQRDRHPAAATEVVLLARQRLPRLHTVGDLIFDLDTPEAAPIEQVRLLKAVREFDAYLRANAGRIRTTGSATALAKPSPPRSPSPRSTR